MGKILGPGKDPELGKFQTQKRTRIGKIRKKTRKEPGHEKYFD
jgi:hypothetical protein